MGRPRSRNIFRTDKDESLTPQFWVRRAEMMTLLGPEQEDYRADLRVTRDSR